MENELGPLLVPEVRDPLVRCVLLDSTLDMIAVTSISRESVKRVKTSRPTRLGGSLCRLMSLSSMIVC